MKTPDEGLLRSFVSELDRALLGGQLQSVAVQDLSLGSTGQVIWLEIYIGAPVFLGFAMVKSQPQLLLMHQKPQTQKAKLRSGKVQLPISLFLAAHARGLTLQSVGMRAGFGRVVEFIFGFDSRRLNLEFQCIPHHLNLIARTLDKKISWAKEQSLDPHQYLETQSVAPSLSILDWSRDWWQQSQGPKSPERPLGAASGNSHLETALRKKSKALALLQQQDLAMEIQNWKERGKNLKTLQTLSQDEEKLFPHGLQRSGWIQYCFDQVKKMQTKALKTSERILQLQAEIVDLEIQISSNLDNPSSGAVPKNSQSRDLLTKEELAKPRLRGFARFRRCEIDGHLVFRGKNGEENLALLRQARPWDFWLHLRDQPGAYGLVLRQKQENIPHSTLEKAAQWLIYESVNKAQGKFDVVCVEAKHVRPVKGAKKGLVTYHHARHFVVASSVAR